MHCRDQMDSSVRPTDEKATPVSSRDERSPLRALGKKGQDCAPTDERSTPVSSMKTGSTLCALGTKVARPCTPATKGATLCVLATKGAPRELEERKGQGGFISDERGTP
jgi:hypothetical protein